jgi:hypothetical protein
VGPIIGLDGVEKREISFPFRGLHPGHQARRYTDRTIAATVQQIGKTVEENDSLKRDTENDNRASVLDLHFGIN